MDGWIVSLAIPLQMQHNLQFNIRDNCWIRHCRPMHGNLYLKSRDTGVAGRVRNIPDQRGLPSVRLWMTVSNDPVRLGTTISSAQESSAKASWAPQIKGKMEHCLDGAGWIERRRSRRDLTLKIENLKNKHHTNEDYHPIILRETHLNQSVRSHHVIIFLQEFFFIFFHW